MTSIRNFSPLLLLCSTVHKSTVFLKSTIKQIKGTFEGKRLNSNRKAMKEFYSWWKKITIFNLIAKLWEITVEMRIDSDNHLIKELNCY